MNGPEPNPLERERQSYDEVALYWERRQQLVYYQVVRFLVSGLSKDAKSILDVGSAGSPFLDWFSHVPEKVSVDLRNPYKGADVSGIKADFLAWEAGRRFDIVTCLQVLEHVPPADLFARKLLTMSNVVVVSVPFEWRAGSALSHVHDPVTREKMRGWFGRDPNFEYICREVVRTTNRLIHVYDTSGQAWASLYERDRNLTRRAERGDGPAMIGMPIRKAEKRAKEAAPAPKPLKRRLISFAKRTASSLRFGRT